MTREQPLEPVTVQQALALRAAIALRDALLFSPAASGICPTVPADAVNPALAHGTDTDAGFGFSFNGVRFYVSVTTLEP